MARVEGIVAEEHVHAAASGALQSVAGAGARSGAPARDPVAHWSDSGLPPRPPRDDVSFGGLAVFSLLRP